MDELSLDERARADLPSLLSLSPLYLSSSNFDIEADNLRAGDSRMGLDEVGAAEVHRIMSEEGVSFDEVRFSLFLSFPLPFSRPLVCALRRPYLWHPPSIIISLLF